MISISVHSKSLKNEYQFVLNNYFIIKKKK